MERARPATCQTCIFSSGNPMHLEPGALRDIVDSAIAQGSYVVCHETLPGMAPPGFAPAICRGFQDRYSTVALEIIAWLWGFVDVDPPSAPAATHGAEASAPTAVPSGEVGALVFVDVDGGPVRGYGRRLSCSV
jgi:hypothetical protein